MLKGWFDRTLLPGPDGAGAWDIPPPSGTGGSPLNGLVPRLTNVKRVVGVSTYGAPRHLVLLAGDNGRNCIGTAIRPVFAPECTCQWLGLYSADGCTDEDRKLFVAAVSAAIRDL